MDTPTYIVILSILISTIIVIYLKLRRTPSSRSLGILLISTSIIWASITLCGEFIFSWAGNTTCSKYLGCVSGFVGYDAFEHLFLGIAGALAIMWLCKRYPKYSILHSERWKVLLVVVATIALISVLWEISECTYDAFRVDILQQPLINFRLHVDLLSQPTNLDTMGDLTFALVGSIIGFFLFKIDSPPGEKSDVKK